MIAVVCHVCRTFVHIGGEPLEVQAILNLKEWEESFPCVRPLCRGRMLRQDPSKQPHGYGVTEMPVHVFYRAAFGFGGVDNPPADLSRVREVLRSKRVVDVKGQSVGSPERTIIEALILEDGSRLHFGVSARGACLYYLEEPHSCVEHVDAEGTGESPGAGAPESDAHREEVGPSDGSAGGIRAALSGRREAAGATAELVGSGVQPVPAPSGLQLDDSADDRS